MRFFKRDGFKCQYCGKSAPDVVLHVDHINPVSKGGSDDLMNLITSCSDCNLGKKDILLTDNSVIEKQRKQLQELNEKREQLEMMLQWRESLANLDQDLVMVITKKVNELIEPHEVNVNGEKND
ncbi:HNH endonuclease [Lonepinella koalarum]|uniref:HNH endonuclease n=1 Tax=Lonepinella koalarum TaxID=53417 RepID=UPI0037045EDC